MKQYQLHNMDPEDIDDTLNVAIRSFAPETVNPTEVRALLKTLFARHFQLDPKVLTPDAPLN